MEDQEAPERSARAFDPALVRLLFAGSPGGPTRRGQFVESISIFGSAKLGERNFQEEAISLLAEKSVGISVANLEQVIEAACRSALKKGVGLSDDLLLEALDTARDGEARMVSGVLSEHGPP